MRSKPSSRALASTLALLALFALRAAAEERFYRETSKEGRLYVFSRSASYEAWSRSGEATGAIVRDGYGPAGETVIFDGEAAVRLYDALHRGAEAGGGANGTNGHGDPPVQVDPAAPAPPRLRWEDGRTVLESANGRLELMNRIQFRFTSVDPDDDFQIPGTGRPGASRSSFRIRRAKTSIEGWFWKKELTYELQLSWAGPEAGASTNTPLEDVYLTWDASRNGAFRITVGQFKVPLGRQEMSTSSGLQFVDRSLLSFEFTRGRDVGVQLSGLVSGGKLEYRAGVFNGNPASHADNENDKFQYNARVTFQPWGDVRYRESDFESTDRPLLAVAGQFEYNDLHGATNGNDLATTTFGGDVVFKYKGLSVFGEYFARDREPETGASFDSNGYNVQVGYFVVRNRVEAALRYAGYDPSDFIPSNDRTEVGGALSCYVNKHNLKVQADFRRLEDDGAGQVSHELRVQTQFVF
jgi:hypothetical protein